MLSTRQLQVSGMKTFIPEALLLLLLANLALTRNPKALITGPHLLEPQFVFDVYLDDLHVERFNSRAETPRLEHCAPWVDQQEPEYWEKRTQDILSSMDIPA
ncbi:H-2 class I histocompatibility antigen, Q10 alpha chain-like isoform X2 [Peromyscus leucopus]|uniref:H-2 class I histocompatibility antigen, Q10 alpha chain-like isoform X2 n=1 Tax=Peromyscus leucopus TaxID=10041 RepID=UPI001884EF65|nr:H-2 class I histocompatibility antigen, Q10 alpha chain-like isoform X2 [Peromyscus leucopus]